jgi:hypothetical protein
MTLAPGEFIRRFMLHVSPKGFHRIRHYGLLASCRTKAEMLAHTRELITAAAPAPTTKAAAAHRRRCNRRQPAVSLPMLRRSRADHRDIRGGLRAAPSTEPKPGRDLRAMPQEPSRGPT